MEYIRSVFSKKVIKLLIASGISALIGAVFILIGTKTTAKLRDQQFAGAWSKEKSFVQDSVFFSEMADFDEDSVKELVYKIEHKLTQDSITSDGNGRLWVYAYSANGKVKAVSSNSSTDVKAIGVGGDFFLFHPLNLLEGSFFGDEGVLDDLVVIDENTAWVLFGSNNVVGQAIEIGGVRHFVSGVVRQGSGRLNDLAGNGQPTIYMSYSSLKKNGQVSYINSFETLMPNPITGYAFGVVEENVPIDKERFEVVENTGRFYWTNLVKNVKNFGVRGMTGKGIIYPYWENIARAYEDYLTPIAIIGCVCFAYPIVLLIVLVIRMWKLRTIHKEDVKDFLERKIEDYREKRKKVKEGEIFDEK